ncbi:hypothetical protein [Paenibacillus bovis]|uniref:Uncharacterized protein n=1 Tax=Paenibacillus bovis TaxID=1616788 RepID=A0A1X9T4A6_9BACL|nr:hypothetical protein [Paenibacillus bovis]ARR10768.1 hypothetical protein AR543_p0160 [Paenibacillus bovis]
MLQIITGKFFDTVDHYETPRKAILYSNFYYDEPIQTIVGTLERVRGTEGAYENYPVINTYLFTYTNRMPKVVNNKPGLLIATGDDEIVEEFSYLCSHGLSAIFSRDKEVIAKYCIQGSEDISRKEYPVSTYFKNHIKGNIQVVEDFIAYVEQFIGQPNATYKHTMECYKNMYHSLLNLNVNLDLAFSQLVYCLESLSQNYDGFIPEWTDYPDQARNKLEKCFNKLGNVEVEEEIKTILIEESHLKSQQRFIKFVLTFVDKHFFRLEAEQIKLPVKRMELEVSLKNTYDRRSKYVHALQSLKGELHLHDNNREVFTFENSPYLTYSGLMRLTRHVIRNFVYSREFLETESVDWRKDLPNLRTIYFNSELWFYSTENFSNDQIIQKMIGFLNIIDSCLQLRIGMSGDPIPLLKLYESKLRSVKDQDKLNMLVVYKICPIVLGLNTENNKYDKEAAKYNHLFDKCSIQGLVISVFKKETFRWKAVDAEKVFRNYKKSSFKRTDKSPFSIIKLPFLIEMGVFIQIANEYLELKNTQKYKEMLEEAIDEFSGDPHKQGLLLQCINNLEIFDLNLLYYSNENDITDSIEYFI